ncbi:helix-turn-helix domain-containing protein [Bacillus sp. Cr_A10]|uniref:helix-turn-helix domain-containing protein n=1 Tax=Bacillus sp. Cr_A10 TaxID=3033993 RepID=UPI0031F354DF
MKKTLQSILKICTIKLITFATMCSQLERGDGMERITLDVRELCNLLGISNTTTYSMVRENKIPYFRIKGKILFNRKVIEDWTRQQSLQKEVVNR